jgi:hypothetical protein
MPDTKLRLPLGVTGWTVYTLLFNESDQVWNSTTSAFVAYVLANIADFDLATPETPAGSGKYVATMPTAPAGNYTWEHRRQVGGAPATSDPLVGSGGGYWTGSEFGSAAASAASNIKKNQALAAFQFVMTSTNGHAPKPNASVTATRSLDGAAFAPCANAPTEISNGVYKINLAASDLNADVVTLRMTAGGCDDLLITLITTP